MKRSYRAKKDASQDPLVNSPSVALPVQNFPTGLVDNVIVSSTEVFRAVFDEASLWALLRLAHREGLVYPKPGCHLSQLSEVRDEALENQILEQLVLTPNVIGFFDKPFG